MAEQVGQLGEIFFDGIEGPGKEMAQIVWEHLLRGHARAPAERFHFAPDIAAVHGTTAFGNKHRAGVDLFCAQIAEELLLERAAQKDGAQLAFAADLDLAAPHGVRRDILELADPNPGGADGLHDEENPLVACVARGAQQFQILRLGELALFAAKDLPLPFERFDAELLVPGEAEEAVERGERDVDRAGGVLRDELFFEPDDVLFGRQGGRLQRMVEPFECAEIVLDGAGTPLLFDEMEPERVDQLAGDTV